MALSRDFLLADRWIGVKNLGCALPSLAGCRTLRRRPTLSSLGSSRISVGFLVRVSQVEDGKQVEGDAQSSFLRMWERAKQRRISEEQEDLERREKNFQFILQVPRDERDRAQRMQVVDRAAAALAAVNALLVDYPTIARSKSANPDPNASTPAATQQAPKCIPTSVVEVRAQNLSTTQSETAAKDATPSSARSRFQATPGPDFWSWVPPLDSEGRRLQPLRKSALPDSSRRPSVQEKSRTSSSLFIPFETDSMEGMIQSNDFPKIFQDRAMPSLSPLQSLLEMEKNILAEKEVVSEEHPSLRVPRVDTETASAVNQEHGSAESFPSGVHQDGSRWWQETGVEYRENDVVCNWTVIRGVSADNGTEWEEKFWEASDPLDYKELGAEKSGRDSTGRVWKEFWREAMWQDAANGLQHIEKMADKWGKDAVGGQWREKWFEHYDASGRAEKWADKWNQIASDTLLERGHAHTWHERWGESFDGQGGSMKYTDKCAERKEDSYNWTRWGDKWDEHFDRQGLGVKQGESWWEGINGQKWNRTWGEEHSASGWVHKYGKSSSGEHWDTHTEEDTWYERKPQFGFIECFENSRQLCQVNKIRKRQL